jgi:acetaldehyde dehydrogenase (acetylating)
MKVAIIGTGNIGMDLLLKLLKTSQMQVVAFVGRRAPTKAIPEGVFYSDKGIQFFIDNPKCCDFVFECTDAFSAARHWAVFSEQNITVIDLTPSKVGKICVPNVNCHRITKEKNVNMVTCGGQVSVPLLHYFSKRMNVSYAEVVTQISADSAGMATRENIDKYIETTESAITKLTNIPTCKVILNLNPMETTVMQTTLFVKGEFTSSIDDFDEYIKVIKKYIPNYTVNVSPTCINKNMLMVSVNIIGSGDYLSKYAGNLDVINCAAVHILKQFIREQSCQDCPPQQGTAPGAYTSGE